VLEDEKALQRKGKQKTVLERRVAPPERSSPFLATEGEGRLQTVHSARDVEGERKRKELRKRALRWQSVKASEGENVAYDEVPRGHGGSSAKPVGGGGEDPCRSFCARAGPSEVIWVSQGVWSQEVAHKKWRKRRTARGDGARKASLQRQKQRGIENIRGLPRMEGASGEKKKTDFLVRLVDWWQPKHPLPASRGKISYSQLGKKGTGWGEPKLGARKYYRELHLRSRNQFYISPHLPARPGNRPSLKVQASALHPTDSTRFRSGKLFSLRTSVARMESEGAAIAPEGYKNGFVASCRPWYSGAASPAVCLKKKKTHRMKRKRLDIYPPVPLR